MTHEERLYRVVSPRLISGLDKRQVQYSKHVVESEKARRGRNAWAAIVAGSAIVWSAHVIGNDSLPTFTIVSDFTLVLGALGIAAGEYSRRDSLKKAEEVVSEAFETTRSRNLLPPDWVLQAPVLDESKAEPNSSVA